MGLPVGPWLKRFKEDIWEGRSEEEKFSVTWEEKGKRFDREFRLGDLKEDIAIITRGQKISYIVDAVYHKENVEEILRLAEDSDCMYCEAAYLDRDREIASERFHLTARQAGELARKAGVKELVIFHFSPRYRDDPDALYKEAMEAFRGA